MRAPAYLVQENFDPEERCMLFVPNKTDFSFNESMIPYFGRHERKQFIWGKPFRFGYKFWCGATCLGYICWFQPYQGKNPNTNYEEYGVGASVVLQFTEALMKEHPGHCTFWYTQFKWSSSNPHSEKKSNRQNPFGIRRCPKK